MHPAPPPARPLAAPPISPRLSPEGHDPRSTERVQVTGRLRRLLVWYGLATLGVYLSFGAVNGVLLPLQIEDLDPARKAANLALVTSLGALAGMVAQPIAGLLSDRTRGRRGRRAPWILTGALVGAAGLVVLGGLGGLVGIAAVYVVVNVALNLYLGPKSALMPDRVPRGVRGLFSAVAGLGVLLGVLGGQALGAALAGAPVVGYGLLAVVIVLAGAGLVLFNPDHDNRDEPRPPLHWSMLLRTFWVSPRRHPDFAYGFVGRLLTFVGFYLVNTFQLFLLQDYVGLGDEAVDMVPLLSGVALLATLVSAVVGGPPSDRMGRRKPVAVGAGLLIAASLVAPWLMPTVTGFVIYSVLAGLGFGSYLAVDQALLSEVLPTTEDNGRYLGVLNIAVTLPSAMAAALAGTIVSTLGYTAIFPIGIAFSVLGALAVLPIRSVR
jgi:MFS family permease